MGKLSNEPIIQHFSHPHPLQLSSLDHLQQQILAQTLCASCRLPSRGGYAYACNPCSYVLHVQCSQMPPLIHHASHRAHPLSLLPVPAYPDGSFRCIACAKPGTGFSYHCRACGVDLHPLCASLPLSVPGPALHAHPLALAFTAPYGGTGFSCDVCGGTGPPGQWMYRCAPCEFDAHLECCGGGRRQVDPVPTMGRSASGRGGGGRGLGRVGSGKGGWMVRQMVQGLVNSATQRIGTRFVPGYVGGGDGGSTAGEANGGGTGYSSSGGAWNGMNNQVGTGGDGYSVCNGNGGGGGGGGGPPGAWNGYGGTGRGGQGRGGGPGTRNDPNGGGGGGTGAWNGYGGGQGRDTQASYDGEGSGASRDSSVDGGDGGGGDGGDYDHVVGYVIAAAGRRAAIDLI